MTELRQTWVFGDDVNTDVLHPPMYYSLDPERVRAGLFKGLDPELQSRLEPGALVLGGRNFGCGSSRETSIRSFKLNEVAAVVAVDFARIFFRSATNLGLPCLQLQVPSDLTKFEHGGRAGFDLENLQLHTQRGELVPLISPGRFVRRIWQAGGLLNLLE